MDEITIIETRISLLSLARRDGGCGRGRRQTEKRRENEINTTFVSCAKCKIAVAMLCDKVRGSKSAAFCRLTMLNHAAFITRLLCVCWVERCCVMLVCVNRRLLAASADTEHSQTSPATPRLRLFTLPQIDFSRQRASYWRADL